MVDIKPRLHTETFSGLGVLGNGVLSLYCNITMVANRWNANLEVPFSEVIIRMAGSEGADTLRIPVKDFPRNEGPGKFN